MTLLELMAVVAIIGIFVALAVPGMAGVLKDRHAARAADDISGIFRVARSRASATGGAHLVRVTASGGSSRFELRSALAVIGGPIASCLTPTWTAGDSREIASVDFGAASGPYAGYDILVTAAGTTPAVRDYCFTPGGSTWVRTAGVWTRPIGSEVALYEVKRTNKATGALIGLRRVVRISPSGIPMITAD